VRRSVELGDRFVGRNLAALRPSTLLCQKPTKKARQGGRVPTHFFCVSISTVSGGGRRNEYHPTEAVGPEDEEGKTEESTVIRSVARQARKWAVNIKRPHTLREAQQRSETCVGLKPSLFRACWAGAADTTRIELQRMPSLHRRQPGETVLRREKPLGRARRSIPQSDAGVQSERQRGGRKGRAWPVSDTRPAAKAAQKGEPSARSSRENEGVIAQPRIDLGKKGALSEKKKEKRGKIVFGRGVESLKPIGPLRGGRPNTQSTAGQCSFVNRLREAPESRTLGEVQARAAAAAAWPSSSEKKIESSGTTQEKKEDHLARATSRRKRGRDIWT